MPTQSQDTQTNSGDNTEDKLETSQAKTGTAVREGQENSSINDDKEDKSKTLEGPPVNLAVNKDDKAINQEEFIEDRNTKKQGPDE